MNNYLEFFAKLIIYAFTLYWLLDYLVKCDVNTKVGSGLYLMMVTFVTYLYVKNNTGEKIPAVEIS